MLELPIFFFWKYQRYESSSEELEDGRWKCHPKIDTFSDLFARPRRACFALQMVRYVLLELHRGSQVLLIHGKGCEECNTKLGTGLAVTSDGIFT